MMDRRLDPTMRDKIYECIAKSPGLHFREIQRRLGTATGVLDYHLHLLKKQGLIRTEKSGKFKRYYASNKKFEEEEKEILNVLRNENSRHVIIYIMNNNNATASDIARALGYKPSKLSGYLKSLIENSTIEQKKNGRYRLYRIKNPKKIARYLKTHKSSFIDDIVDRFIEAWTS